MRLCAALTGLIAGLALGGAAHAGCQLGTTDLPITMVGLKPVFPAKINGSDVRFIADSGAFFSVISPAAAAALSLPTQPAPFGLYMSGVGGTAEISVARAKTFELAKSSLSNVDFVVGGSDVGGGVTVGVLGENVLGMADAEYDLAGGVIRIARPKDCGSRSLAYWAKDKTVSELDIEPHDPRQQPFIVGTVLVNGVRVRATFDTGADVSVLSLRAARRAGIRTDGPNVRFAGYTSGFGRRPVQSWIAAVDSFALGGESIQHTQLRIGELPEDTEMLVGADFFLSHHIYVANSQDKLYFTYNGGPVFNLTNQPLVAAQGQGDTTPSAIETPKDADEFSRTGAALAARHDYDGALAAFDKAVALAPTEPRYLYERARLRLDRKQPVLAMADLDAALKLRPDDAEMRLVRAELRLIGHDKDGALVDLDAASRVAPKPSDLRLQMAGLYDQMEKFAPAVEQYDLWTHDHGDDSRLAEALNGRCWARGLWNQALDRAMSDCNAAVRLTHGSPDALDSRGLVHLRRGETAQAIADYDAALKLNPKLAWSLYGRGVAEERTGAKAQGEQDIAAAATLAPKLLDKAARLGLAPPDGPPSAPVEVSKISLPSPPTPGVNAK